MVIHLISNLHDARERGRRLDKLLTTVGWPESKILPYNFWGSFIILNFLSSYLVKENTTTNIASFVAVEETAFIYCVWPNMYHMTHLLQCLYSIRHTMSWHHTVVAIIIIVVVVGIPNRTVLQPCFKSIRVCNRNPKCCMRMNEWLPLRGWNGSVAG